MSCSSLLGSNDRETIWIHEENSFNVLLYSLFLLSPSPVDPANSTKQFRSNDAEMQRKSEAVSVSSLYLPLLSCLLS